MSDPIDARNRLDDEPFDYQQTKDGRVFLFYEGKRVKTLAGKAAEKFLKQIARSEGKAAQLVMAKVTGNFKRGNERTGKNL
jgi:hypothetical protein